MKRAKGIFIYTAIIFLISLFYFVYLKTIQPPVAESETFRSEIGKGFGNISLWLLIFIYARTLMKLSIGKGGIARRLIPDFQSNPGLPVINNMLIILNKTHRYVGITTGIVIILHVVLVDRPMKNLFFQGTLALVIWQGLFGLFLSWRYSPRELKKLSYLVHAQFLTGIMIGIFTIFGHALIDS